MERNLKVLIKGARYIVSGVFCTLTYDIETDQYTFLPSNLSKTILQGKFQSIDKTSKLRNPIFDLSHIPFTIKDYTLEEGDYCKDFPKFVAVNLVKKDNATKALESNLIYLFSSKSLHWDKDKEFAPKLKTEYYPGDFLSRYRNMLLIEPAENFL